MASKDLFLDAIKGVVPLYKKKLDALKTTIAAYRDNTFIPTNTCGSSNFDGCIPPRVDMWWKDGNAVTQASITPINGCDGQSLNLSVPAGIMRSVPSALLTPSTAGGYRACLKAEWFTGGPHNLDKNLRMRLLISYGAVLLATLVGVPGAGGYSWNAGCVCPDPFTFIYPGAYSYWDRTMPVYDNFGKVRGSIALRATFEDSSLFTVSLEPWAQRLTDTLSAKRAQYYQQVPAEFTKDGPIGRAATDLNVAKGLLTSFIELGMPRSLQGNDLLRSLLYGNQQLYFGLDPANGLDVKSLYSTAGSASPEFDIAPATDKRFNAVATVMTQVFAQIAARQFRETNLQLEAMIRKLDDYVNVAEAAPPTCTFSVFPTTLVSGSSGGPLSLSISTDSACAWSIGGLPAWATASPASGKGPATVTLTVQANQSDARSASFLAADKTITLSQDAKAQTCTFTITPSAQSFPAAGGSLAIDITASAPSCLWSISGLPTWATVSSTSGSGSARVTLQITANAGTARSVTATVASRPFSIDQTAATTGGAAGLLVRNASAGPGKTLELAIGLIGAGNKPVAVQFDSILGAAVECEAAPHQVQIPDVRADVLERY